MFYLFGSFAFVLTFGFELGMGTEEEWLEDGPRRDHSQKRMS